jgi:hypothetical protein
MPMTTDFPIGEVMERDPAVMPKVRGDWMLLTPMGWMVGPREQLERCADEMAEGEEGYGL